MELLLGFFIAALIAMTGVGAGTVTAPLLIVFLGVPIPEAVGTALAYSAVVKLIVVPVQIWRKNVEWRTLGVMLATGVPGVILGAILFRRVVADEQNAVWLYLALGSMIALSSGWHIYRHFRPNPKLNAGRAYKPGLLAAIMLPVGAEVGFSSSGAGALGTLSLMGLTPLETRRIVGTDLAFGLVLSLLGGGMHLSYGGLDSGLLTQLIIGGVFGALVGTGLASRVPPRAMKLALSVWLLVLGVQLFWHAFAHPHI
ncbi:MAG: sulfite exporter TauE/SafE family protein [Acidobacteriota bacterium]|nr:sulfite exporter TauE/SafE family protein [Acidobacteriota bacterium]